MNVAQLHALSESFSCFAFVTPNSFKLIRADKVYVTGACHRDFVGMEDFVNAPALIKTAAKLRHTRQN